jgi:hypothetical protein
LDDREYRYSRVEEGTDHGISYGTFLALALGSSEGNQDDLIGPHPDTCQKFEM